MSPTVQEAHQLIGLFILLFIAFQLRTRNKLLRADMAEHTEVKKLRVDNARLRTGVGGMEAQIRHLLKVNEVLQEAITKAKPRITKAMRKKVEQT